MSKPVVKYFQSLWPPIVGQRAAIFICSPHPVLGELPPPKWVHTSEVLKINEKGDLETLNTEYIKVENPSVVDTGICSVHRVDDCGCEVLKKQLETVNEKQAETKEVGSVKA